MQKPNLSNYFKGVAAKRLSTVEVKANRSNQHEFNGVQSLKEVFGTEKRKFNARFIYLGAETEEKITDTGYLTWYDARDRHPHRTEYRCYYPSNTVIEQADEGDLLVLGLRQDGTVIVVIAGAGTTAESQLQWLFTLPLAMATQEFAVKQIDKKEDVHLNYAGRSIMDEIGIEVETVDDNYLDKMLTKFHGVFPPTRVFSSYARETLPEVDDLSDPDAALMEWMDREEVLFRTLERYLVGKRIEEGFKDDIDSFISFSLTVHNRRKSRAGLALENHFEEILKHNNLSYSRSAITENRARPDFIFPGIKYYQDRNFPEFLLTMLGVKATCKDRWRQVLSEAARINDKHLLTLEPRISQNQTQEMRANKTHLVVPLEIQKSYKCSQLKHMVDVKTFLEVLKCRQQTIDKKQHQGNGGLSVNCD